MGQGRPGFTHKLDQLQLRASHYKGLNLILCPSDSYFNYNYYKCLYVRMYLMQQRLRTLTQVRKTIKPKFSKRVGASFMLQTGAHNTLKFCLGAGSFLRSSYFSHLTEEISALMQPEMSLRVYSSRPLFLCPEPDESNLHYPILFLSEPF
jgi:hypothetical protein